MSKDSPVVTSEEASSQASPSFWKKIDNALCLQNEEEREKFTNRDMNPLPPFRRTWKAWQLACFWGSDIFNASALRTVVSFTAIGLSSGMALLATVLGFFIIGIVLALNGRFGIFYHVPFSVQGRASYGYFFSYLMIVLRMIVGGLWYGVNAYTGGECIRSIIYAIWPSFRNVPNHLPEGANIDTQMMTAYVIYFIISLPFHYISQERVQWMYAVKTLVLPGALFAMLGWGLAASTDRHALWYDDNQVHNSAFSWVFVSSVTSSIATFTTLAVNVNDFTRYSNDKMAPVLQIFILPVFIFFVSAIGVVMGKASEQRWGVAMWDPLLVLDQWTSRGGRAASFFLAVIFLFGQICVNLSNNCASAANDLNALFPRYINIRRGQFIIATIFAWAATPWNILNGAAQFINFLSGYGIFLGPMAAIQIFDYYFVHNGKYDVREFYNKDGMYRYNKTGINWRALVAFIVGFAPQLPGFGKAINANTAGIPEGMMNFYSLGFFYNFPVSGLVYVALSKLFPPKQSLLDERVLPDDIQWYGDGYSDEVLEEEENYDGPSKL